MTTEGWITMIVSIGGVISITTWCFVKIFSTPDKKEDVHGIELVTPDMADDDTTNEAQEKKDQ